MPASAPTLLTTRQLAEATAGGDDYIRTKDNKVRGLALRLDLNPDAPEVIAFGDGHRIVARAELFLKSCTAVPTYVKRAVDAWVYLGEYQATAIRKDAATIRAHAVNRKDKIAGVLFLESVAEPIVRVSGGGYADPETRCQVEQAAIAFVIRSLESRGYRVEDRQRENRGYDLLATRMTDTLLVEVKGTDSPKPRFFVSRNEWKVGKLDPRWRLLVVCLARSQPTLLEYTATEIEHGFELDALAWECTQRNP